MRTETTLLNPGINFFCLFIWTHCDFQLLWLHVNKFDGASRDSFPGLFCAAAGIFGGRLLDCFTAPSAQFGPWNSLEVARNQSAIAFQCYSDHSVNKLGWLACRIGANQCCLVSFMLVKLSDGLWTILASCFKQTTLWTVAQSSIVCCHSVKQSCCHTNPNDTTWAVVLEAVFLRGKGDMVSKFTTPKSSPHQVQGRYFLNGIVSIHHVTSQNFNFSVDMEPRHDGLYVLLG